MSSDAATIAAVAEEVHSGKAAKKADYIHAEKGLWSWLSTLDHKRGGEIATNLDRLYRFMLDHLLEANLVKSARHVMQVRRIFGIIGGAYREVLRNGMPQLDVA